MIDIDAIYYRDETTWRLGSFRREQARRNNMADSSSGREKREERQVQERGKLGLTSFTWICKLAAEWAGEWAGEWE